MTNKCPSVQSFALCRFCTTIQLCLNYVPGKTWAFTHIKTLLTHGAGLVVPGLAYADSSTAGQHLPESGTDGTERPVHFIQLSQIPQQTKGKDT